MNYSQKSLNRRAFLYAAGTAGVALPFLEGMPERSAFAQTPSSNPVYGLFICTANGVTQKYGQEPERFWPTATGPLTTASMEEFSAERATGLLSAHAERLLVISGMSYPQQLSGCGHAQGLAQCLTGRSSSGGGNGATSTGPSVDYVAAQALNPAGVEGLNLYSGQKQGYIDEKLSFSAAGRVRAAEGNPYNVYQRLAGLFTADEGGGTSGPTTADRLAMKRKSVNDLIRDQITDLSSKPQLSQADRDRLDLHFTTIRDVETTMQNMGVACSDSLLDVSAVEAMNSGMAFRANTSTEQVSILQAELAALTFACDANRVAALQIGDGTDASIYNINGQNTERFHWVSHRVRSDGSSGASIPQAHEWHVEIDRIRMQSFSRMIELFDQYSTPNGSLLDNGFLYWTNQIAVGPAHTLNNVPVIIAGNAGGYLKQGAYIDVDGAHNNQVLNTLLTAMGAPNEGFGGANGVMDEMIA